MIHYTEETNDAWRGLRRVLDGHDYDQLLRAIRGLYYSYDPWLGDESYRFFHEAMPLPDGSRALFELFLMGRTLRASRVEEVVGEALVGSLIEAGLLLRRGSDICTDQYAIIAQGGQYFIVTYISQENPKRAFNVYVGQDSYKLLHSLDRSRRGVRVLDLCAGSGILGQAMTPWASKVVGIELCDEAVEVGRANAVLNGVEDVWEVRQGDLWAPVADETFDLILSNPPFIAVPMDIDFPIYGWGGEDGLLLIEKILAKLPEAFAPGGRAQLVFEGVGSATRLAVEPLLEALAKEQPGWAIKFLPYDRTLLTESSFKAFGEAAAHISGKATSQAIEKITKEALDLLRERDFQYMYKVLVFIESEPLVAPGLVSLPIYNPWDGESQPEFKGPMHYEEAKSFLATSHRDVTLRMTPVEREIAGKFDGETSITEAATKAHKALGGAGVSLETFVTQGAELCRIMHQIDFLKRPANTQWDNATKDPNPFIAVPEENPMQAVLDSMQEMFQMMKAELDTATDEIKAEEDE